jgi:ubiquitin-activating enzyme E1
MFHIITLYYKYKVVILTDSSNDEQIEIGKFCHKSGIKFLCADSKGLFGKIFVDFGPEFLVNDINGQTPKCSMISFISQTQDKKKCIINTFDDTRHDLEEGCFITLSEIKGMTELNGKEFKVNVLGPYCVSIDLYETTNCNLFQQLNPYESGGFMTEVKKSKLINFKPIDMAIEEPDYLISDYTKIQDNDTIHIAFQTLSEFKKKNNNQSPKPWNKTDSAEFINIAESLINNSLKKPFQYLNKQLLELFSFVCAGNLCPLNSVIGGMIAQEAIKAVTGKFHPIVQYFYYDCRECLEESENNYSDKIVNTNESTSRYVAQEIIFGTKFQSKLESLNIFLVGSGALGCEYIKNFAMMGLCTNETNGGRLTVTGYYLFNLLKMS